MPVAMPFTLLTNASYGGNTLILQLVEVFFCQAAGQAQLLLFRNGSLHVEFYLT